MSKELFLIRHANAVSIPFKDDFSRALTPRGCQEAEQMAERLSLHKDTPGYLISSPAIRALSTAEIFAGHMGIPSAQIQLQRPIYEASMGTLLHIINQVDDQHESIALFGHNPGISTIGQYLCPDITYTLSTSSIVQLHFEFECWNMVSAGSAKLVWNASPR